MLLIQTFTLNLNIMCTRCDKNFDYVLDLSGSRMPSAIEEAINFASDIKRKIVDLALKDANEFMSTVAARNELDEVISGYLCDDNELDEDTEVSVHTQKNLTVYEFDYELNDDEAMELHAIISEHLRKLSLKKKGE